MKKNHWIILCTTLYGMFLSASSLEAQEWKLASREEIEAKVHPRLMKQAKDILRFDTCRLSVGNLSESDTPRTVSFHFRNVSKQPVTITKITTSCGCTVAQFSSTPIAPQEESILSLTFHPKNRPGTIDTQALVYTQLSEQAPVAKLSLCGYVSADDEWNHLPQSMGKLRLSRKKLTFHLADNTATERILCANSSNEPLQLKAVLPPSCFRFYTEPAVLAPGQEGDLVITFDSKQLPSLPTSEKHYSLMIDGINCKPSERTIDIIIKN